MQVHRFLEDGAPCCMFWGEMQRCPVALLVQAYLKSDWTLYESPSLTHPWGAWSFLVNSQWLEQLHLQHSRWVEHRQRMIIPNSLGRYRGLKLKHTSSVLGLQTVLYNVCCLHYLSLIKTQMPPPVFPRRCTPVRVNERKTLQLTQRLTRYCVEATSQ